MIQDDNHLKTLEKDEAFFFYVGTLAAAGSPDGARSDRDCSVPAVSNGYANLNRARAVGTF